MTAQEQRTTARALARIRDAYPRQPFPDSTIRLYGESLADLPDTLVYEVVDRLIRTSPYFPSIAEIRQEAAELICRLPTAAEAWTVATSGLKVTQPEIKQAIQAVGGPWSIMHGDNPTTIRAQFLRDYEARRAATVREVTVTGTRRELPPAGIASLDAYRAREIPPTERIVVRPIAWRTALRNAGRTLEAPSEEEQGDAIRWLETFAVTEPDSPITLEAFRVFEECGRHEEEASRSGSRLAPSS